MLTFDPVPVGNNTYQMQEIIFNDSLKVAVIDKSLNEKRISAFLSHVLANAELPLKMTVQERYFLMLKYVEKQSNTLFSSDTDFSACFLNTDSDWLPERTINGISMHAGLSNQL